MSVFGLQNAFGGNIAQRIAPAEVIAIYGPGIGPANAVTATSSNGFLSDDALAASRSAVPLAVTSAVSTTNPLRFSISTLPH